jgi:hypothetical protein
MAGADASIWPILLTGLFTLGGSLGAIAITSLATSQRDAAHERREVEKRRADKFEELVAALYEFDDWIERHSRATAGTVEAPQTMSPLAKVQTISSVYFPQFEESVRELDFFSANYLILIWSTDRRPGYNEGMDQAHSDAQTRYGQELQSLLDALKAFAHDEFQ